MHRRTGGQFSSMARLSLCLCVVLLMISGHATDAAAKLATVPLVDMVACADYVLIGSTVATRVGHAADSLPRLSGSRISTIAVDEMFKGEPTRRLAIVTYADTLEEAVPKLGQQAIFFLRQIDGHLYVLHGYGGLLPIRDGRVDAPYIADYDVGTSFRKQIESVVGSDPKCSRVGWKRE